MAKRVADQSIKEFETSRNSKTGMGCQSQLGCIAGKKHDAYHKYKLDSDINNLLEFRTAQLKENKIIIQNLTDAANNINIAALQFQNIKEDVKENKKQGETEWQKRDKRIHWFDVRNWGIFAAIIVMCFGTIIATIKITAENKINQGNTKGLMLYLAAKISKQPLEDIKNEVAQLIGENDLKANQK